MPAGRVATRPLQEGFGAEVLDLDLRAPLDDDVAAELRELFARKRVLLFRGQALRPEDQISALSLFGRVVDESRTGARFVNVSAEPSSLVKPGRLLFHVERHPTPVPLQGLSLYGDVIGEDSTTTLFADMVGVVDRLPAVLRARIEPLRALNVTFVMLGVGSARSVRSIDADPFEAPGAVHPLLTPHPQTGERVLFVSELNTHHVLGLDRAASDALLDELLSWLYAPSNVYEHSWRQGDLLVWDNWGAQHARGEESSAAVEEGAASRRLRRVTISQDDLSDHYRAQRN